MKKNVTLIVGLPASGKTSLGQSLSLSQGSVLIDDPSSIYKAIKDIIEASDNSFIVIHPQFCEEVERNLIIQDLKNANFNIDVIYFENNKEQCLKNDHNRGNLSQNDIEYFSSVYNPPKNVKLEKVHPL